MTAAPDPAVVVDELRRAFEGSAGSSAPAMARYLRDQFPFLGVAAEDRRAAQRPVLGRIADPEVGYLDELARRLYDEPEREFAYAACDLLARWAPRSAPGLVETLEHLVTTRSWWDTVDVLASRVAGPLVARHPDLRGRPDRWIKSDQLWLQRTAILYQLRYGPETDAERLFDYCRRRADSQEFFLRKAIGWALRQYARSDPDAVRSFLEEMGDDLSPLSRREAAKHL